MNENNILDVEQSVQNDNSIPESTTVDTAVEIEESAAETDETVADPEAEQSEADGSASVEGVTEDVEAVQFPEYSVENPLPVMLVETEEETTPQEELEVFALSGTYNGTISDTYLDYFEGIVEKLKPNEHYVIWRSGQYAYNMCYGENIELDGTYFSGDCQLVQIYRSSDSYSSDWYVSTSSDNLALSATDIFAYSDLGMYPTVERGHHMEKVWHCLSRSVWLRSLCLLIVSSIILLSTSIESNASVVAGTSKTVSITYDKSDDNCWTGNAYLPWNYVYDFNEWHYDENKSYFWYMGDKVKLFDSESQYYGYQVKFTRTSNTTCSFDGADQNFWAVGTAEQLMNGENRGGIVTSSSFTAWVPTDNSIQAIHMAPFFHMNFILSV